MCGIVTRRPGRIAAATPRTWAWEGSPHQRQWTFCSPSGIQAAVDRSKGTGVSEPAEICHFIRKAMQESVGIMSATFPGKPFDPRSHVSHNGWSPIYYTCFWRYLIQTHRIICSEHHSKSNNEPVAFTSSGQSWTRVCGWWGHDPATQINNFRRSRRVYQVYLSILPQLYLLRTF